MRSAALALVLALPTAARGDTDPRIREAFGLPTKPPPAPPSCSDDRTLGCATASDRLAPQSPALVRSWLDSSYLLGLPVGNALQFDVADFAAGAARDAAGPAFLGATGLENAWTVEGAPIENLRNGNLETRIPLVFTTGLLVSVGGFAARDRVGLGGAIDVELLRGGTRHQVRGDVWTGFSETARQRPIASASFQLKRLAVQPGLDNALAITARGPLPSLADGRTWYAVGLAPSLSTTDVTARAARATDRDGDRVIDGFPGVIELDPITTVERTSVDYVIPVMARAGWERGPHDVAFTLLGNGVRDTLVLANASAQAAGIVRTTWLGDAIASWTGRWSDTRAHALAMWHRSLRRERARDDGAAASSQLLSAYIPKQLPDDPELADACNDGPGDVFSTIVNCPVPFGFFASGGAGKLTDQVADRPVISADIAHRWGDHVVRGGGTFEDGRLIATSRFTGGALVRSLFPTHTDTEQFLAGECGSEPDSPCSYADRSELVYRTRYAAAFVEDTFAAGRNLQIDGGVRWELMQVGARLQLTSGLAPRLGIAWDFLGNGQSRAFASLARSHALLPAGMGATVIARDQSVRDVVFEDLRQRTIDLGGTLPVATGIVPATTDEGVVGIEAGIIKALRGTLWVAHRSLRSGIETVVTNPATFAAQFGNPGATAGPPARREATTVAAELHIAPSPRFGVRATYLYGRAVGNWTGPFDPRQGATLYAGTDWDGNSANLDGELPSSIGHRATLEASRQAKFGAIPYAVSARLVIASGRPRNVISDSDEGTVYVIPRGGNGRTPMISQADLRVATRVGGFDLTLDILNVFDRRDPTSANESYGDNIRPLQGGSYSDLVFAKIESCGEMCVERRPLRRTAFGLPLSFQPPRALLLGAHRSF